MARERKEARPTPTVSTSNDAKKPILRMSSLVHALFLPGLPCHALPYPPKE